MKSPSKFSNFIHKICPILFGALFFTLPTCSLRTGWTWITWIATAVTMVVFLLDIILNKTIKIDIFTIMFIAFFGVYFISFFLNKMKGFFLTTLLLQAATLFFYTYIISTNQDYKKMFFWIFLGTIAFLVVFFVTYFKELISFDFYRIGEKFGDVNDISMFFGLGFMMCTYYSLFIFKTWKRFLLIPVALLFMFAGASTGSKIFIFIVATVFIFSLFAFFGKKKIWLSCLIVAAFVVTGVVLLQMPFAHTVKIRLEKMLELFGFNISVSPSGFDYSSYFRYLSFFDGLKMFGRKPLFGFGPSGFLIFGGTRYAWTHNHIAESLCNYGIVGFLIFNFGYFASLLSLIFDYDRKRILGYILLVFFLIIMTSVAFFTEKLHAFLFPFIPFICCEKTKRVTISFNKKGLKLIKD